ncbi:CHAT domain-containing protein [Gammaproteobacteria bacterium]
MKSFIITMLLALFIVGSASAESTLELARQARARGDWEQVETLLTAAGDTEELLLRGEARRVLGYLDRAREDHETAWRQVEGEKETTGALRDWAVLVSAETLLEQKEYPATEQRLNLLSADAGAEEQIRGEILRGRLEMARGHAELARAAYLRAREKASRAEFAGLDVQARLGILDLDSNLPPLKEIENLVTAIDRTTPDHARTTLWLGLAERLRRATPQSGYLTLAQALVEKAAPRVTPGRQTAELLALRAALLEMANHPAESLTQAGAAITEARRIDAGDILMNEEWRRGRLYQALGDADRALSALRRAVFHLHRIRVDIPVEYQAGHSSFRETLAPLYLKLADLLLQQAARLSDDDAQPLLREARDTVEQLKAAELEDYLGGACRFDTKPVANLETIAPRTGVLYPILLPDRLELLLGIGERQFRATVAVKAETIRRASEQLAEKLRGSDDQLLNPKSLANQLFAWIIAPIQSQLSERQVDTLVIIPDGPLRLFPFGALMDGDSFLIERYAIVTEPGLTLIDPQPLARVGIQTLVAGMSRPGPVIDELPLDIVNSLAGATRGVQNRGLIRGQGLDKSRAAAIRNVGDLSNALQDPAIRKHIEDALALPGVDKEVESVSSTLNSQPMLNQDFVLERFGAAMGRSLRVVHVASHGFFGGSPDNSFFMTYDHLLTMNQLETLLQGTGENEDPPELLTLSACQTAEGNDRSPLGITGVAIKSGARSALGSLWPVSDDATQVLLAEFYRQLRDPQQTKAKAFQQAQLMVLHDQRFNHPFFWSPFILVGNWL